MKVFLLLCVLSLNVFALMLPSLGNPSLWGIAGEAAFSPPKGLNLFFRYSEPVQGYYNGKFDVTYGKEKFAVAAGAGSLMLDSIYRELEFSGMLAYSAFSFLTFKLSETANIAWIPSEGSWAEHNVSLGADFLPFEWGKLNIALFSNFTEKEPPNFSGAVSWILNLNESYSFGGEIPIARKNGFDFCFYQNIKVGILNLYNSFAWNSDYIIGLGFSVGVPSFEVGIGHFRAGSQNGHLGYMFRFGNY